MSKTPKGQLEKFVITRGGLENALMRMGITEQADLNSYFKEVRAEAVTDHAAAPIGAIESVVDYLEQDEGDDFNSYAENNDDEGSADHIYKSVLALKAAVDPAAIRKELQYHRNLMGSPNEDEALTAAFHATTLEEALGTSAEPHPSKTEQKPMRFFAKSEGAKL